MSRGALARWLPRHVKTRLKEARRALLVRRDRLFAVDAAVFRDALLTLGIRAGDVLYVRSSWDEMRSIRATPVEIIGILAQVVGDTGTLVMPTYPTGGLSSLYLQRQPTFDWRRTPSKSGLLTEVFRRMPGTERSLHPTHPVAARGALAVPITTGHQRSETPFDVQSPFQRLLEADAVVLSIGRFEAMTLRHFADHLIRDLVPYPLYEETPVMARVIDRHGRDHLVATRALNPSVTCDHRIVVARMAREGIVRRGRVGLVPLSAVRIRPYMDAYRRYYQGGLFRHSLRAAPRPNAQSRMP